MPNTYTWTFPALTAYPEYASQTDVVREVHWTLTADDGQGHIATTYGSVGLVYEAGSSFTPFAQLTQAQVQEWVSTKMGPDSLASLENKLQEQIQQQVAPIEITQPAPWATTQAV